MKRRGGRVFQNVVLVHNLLLDDFLDDVLERNDADRWRLAHVVRLTVLHVVLHNDNHVRPRRPAEVICGSIEAANAHFEGKQIIIIMIMIIIIIIIISTIYIYIYIYLISFFFLCFFQYCE